MIESIILSGDLAAKAGGYMIAAVGWIIVFTGLIGLIAVFMALPKIINFFIRLKLKKTGKETATGKISIDANVNAAIATALHLYFNEMHDEESNIITIKNAPKQYSPWSSKIYSVNNQPHK